MGRLFWKLFWRFWGALGLLNTAIGMSGVPGDLDTWARWIGFAMSDPLVYDLAHRAAAIAGFVNQDWFRVSLVVVGLLMFFWPLRWFWRLRHKLSFRWRRLVADQVWISEETAIELIKESGWGRLKEPRIVETVSVLDIWAHSLQRERTVHGLSASERSLLKFDHFLLTTLDSFASANPAAVKEEDGVRQIDETALRAFLKMAMNAELAEEFGETPTFKVT